MFYFLHKLKNVYCLKLVIKRSLGPLVRQVTTYTASSSPGPLASARALLSSRPLVANCIIHGLLYTGSEFLQQSLMIILGEDEEDRGFDTGPILR